MACVGHVVDRREPALPDLLTPAGVVQRHDDVRTLRLEVGWRVVERQMAVFADPGECHVDRRGGDETPNFVRDALGIAFAVEEVIVDDARRTDESIEQVFPKARRVIERQPDVFIEMKQLDLLPVDAGLIDERVEKRDLRSPCRRDDTRAAPCRNRVANRLRRLHGCRATHGSAVPVCQDPHLTLGTYRESRELYWWVMKIALIGMPQVGKKTLFSLMTGMPYDQLTSRSTEYAVGMVKVTDSRVDKLTALYKPKKTKYAEIECTLTPAPPKEAKPREQWLGKLKDMDAFCHVVRAFDDESVFHASGSVDPLRDIEMMSLELAITDLSLVELRLDRIAQEQKKKADAASVQEAALLETLKPYLESGKSLREHPMQEAELKKIRSLQFLTLKSMVTALNCGESNFPNPQLIKAAQTKVTGNGNELCALSAKVESEVAQIGDPGERAEFLQALGIEEPAVNVLTRLLYKALGYICFFTVGEDEVRAWTIHRRLDGLLVGGDVVVEDAEDVGGPRREELPVVLGCAEQLADDGDGVGLAHVGDQVAPAGRDAVDEAVEHRA